MAGAIEYRRIVSIVSSVHLFCLLTMYIWLWNRIFVEFGDKGRYRPRIHGVEDSSVTDTWRQGQTFLASGGIKADTITKPTVFAHES